MIEDAIRNYQMSDDSADLVQKTKLMLIAGIVGGGKNTVIHELLKSGDFYRVVSHTTRQPRSNHGVLEQNDVDYHFISLGAAEKLVTDRAFIEAKYVHDNVYGTSAIELQNAQDQGKIAVMDIDVQGVTEYLDIKPDAHAVFLLPPSVDTWLQRLEGRYGSLDDHQEEITKRFRTAQDEIKHIQADKRFVLVINDDLQTTVARVRGVLDGSVSHTSDYAEAVTEHLLEFVATKI